MTKTYIYRAIYAVTIYIIAFISSGLLFFISYQFMYGQSMPDVDKLPMFSAPYFTMIMGIIACGEQTRLNSNIKLKDVKIERLNLIAMSIIFFSCLFLSAPTKAVYHVTIVLILFSFFWVWDNLMIKWLRGKPGFAEEIRRISVIHKLINIPTVIGFCIILLLILFHSEHNNGHPFIDIVQRIFSQVTINEDRKKLISSEEELFVSGVIAFHLVTVAIAFFIATHMRLGLEKGKEDTQKTSNG